MTGTRVCMDLHPEDPVLNKEIYLEKGKLTSGRRGSQEGVHPSKQNSSEQGLCSGPSLADNGDNESGQTVFEGDTKKLEKVRKWKRKSRDNTSDSPCETQRKRKSEDVEWTLHDTLEVKCKKHNSGCEVPSQLEKVVAESQPRLSP